eukprot:TRINITY_DN210_c0_g2_i3.p1 TRINITY_DN210_c0_g2~~TRINITY_DN210_c0_g2_i3.p1  ORF type:complete len:578 (-),score=96.89 TRINITY_DN210_c0_g2_i3:566-2299(-)
MPSLSLILATIALCLLPRALATEFVHAWGENSFLQTTTASPPQPERIPDSGYYEGGSSACAVSETRMVIGASGAPNTAGELSVGAVHVYLLPDGSYAQTLYAPAPAAATRGAKQTTDHTATDHAATDQTEKASGQRGGVKSRAGELFGAAVALQLRLLVVGAPGRNGVFVYTSAQIRGPFHIQQEISLPTADAEVDQDANQGFGALVAADEEAGMIAVGALAKGSSVLIYTNSGAKELPWRKMQVLTPPAKTPTQIYSLALSSALASDGSATPAFLAVGMPRAEVVEKVSPNNSAEKRLELAGVVYVYGRNEGGRFVRPQEIIHRNPRAYDLFGSSVAVRERVLVVGMPQPSSDASGGKSAGGADGSDAGSTTGSVIVYTYAGSSWAWAHELGPSPRSVPALEAMHSAAKGSGGRSSSKGGSAAGATSKGGKSDDSKDTSRGVTLPDRLLDVGSLYGVSVALSPTADAILVGQPARDNFRGAAWLYLRVDGQWTAFAHLRAANPRAFDQFGTSVALARTTAVAVAKYADASLEKFVVRDRGAMYYFDMHSKSLVAISPLSYLYLLFFFVDLISFDLI